MPDSIYYLIAHDCASRPSRTNDEQNIIRKRNSHLPLQLTHQLNEASRIADHRLYDSVLQRTCHTASRTKGSKGKTASET